MSEEVPEESSRKRSRKKYDLFEQSAMTEQQRRAVRHQQRLLHDKIEQGHGSSDDNDDDDDNNDNDTPSDLAFLSKVRDENNQLFDSVRYTREAVLDANNHEKIVEKTLMNLDKMREVCTERSINTAVWITFALAVVSHSAVAPRVAVLTGRSV